MTPNAATTKLLENLYLFRPLTDEQREELLRHCCYVKLDKEEMLFNQGQKAHYFYILEQGQVRLSLKSIQGIDKVISVIRPGEVFAEAVTFLEKQQYPASCTAIKKSSLVGIDMQKFTEYLTGSNQLCMAMIHDLCLRLRRKINEIEGLSLQNATIRTVCYLNSMIPEQNDKEVYLTLDTPKHTIASMLSITPETFSRVLKQLQEQQLLTIQDNTVYIPNSKPLRELIYSY